MGVRNYLIEGVSGVGKTSVAEALERRGYHVVHGDRVLAYCGDPQSGARLELPEGLDPAGRAEWTNAHWIWALEAVQRLLADHTQAVTFFCGASRNSDKFIALFDAVLVLDVDRQSLLQRLDRRPQDEFGGAAVERQLILELHASQRDIPKGVMIDATAPLVQVVDAVLAQCGLSGAA